MTMIGKVLRNHPVAKRRGLTAAGLDSVGTGAAHLRR
jgi:hypothetical protein